MLCLHQAHRMDSTARPRKSVCYIYENTGWISTKFGICRLHQNLSEEFKFGSV